MHESMGRPHMLTSNQRGRGHDPVTVAGRIMSFVMVSIVRKGSGAEDPDQREGSNIKELKLGSA